MLSGKASFVWMGYRENDAFRGSERLSGETGTCPAQSHA